MVVYRVIAGHIRQLFGGNGITNQMGYSYYWQIGWLLIDTIDTPYTPFYDL